MIKKAKMILKTKESAKTYPKVKPVADRYTTTDCRITTKAQMHA